MTEEGRQADLKKGKAPAQVLYPLFLMNSQNRKKKYKN